jgi:hypothetical protein
LEVAAAVRFIQRVTMAFTPTPGVRNAVGTEIAAHQAVSFELNIEDRARAEFTSEEINSLRPQPALRSSPLL